MRVILRTTEEMEKNIILLLYWCSLYHILCPLTSKCHVLFLQEIIIEFKLAPTTEFKNKDISFLDNNKVSGQKLNVLLCPLAWRKSVYMYTTTAL